MAQESATVGICGDSGEWPPYIYFERDEGKKTERVAGFSIDVIGEVLDEEGIDYTIELLPWKRCLRNVEAGAASQIALDASYSEERAKSYFYSRPYYTVEPYYF